MKKCSRSYIGDEIEWNHQCRILEKIHEYSLHRQPARTRCNAYTKRMWMFLDAPRMLAIMRHTPTEYWYISDEQRSIGISSNQVSKPNATKAKTIESKLLFNS